MKRHECWKERPRSNAVIRLCAKSQCIINVRIPFVVHLYPARHAGYWWNADVHHQSYWLSQHQTALYKKGRGPNHGIFIGVVHFDPPSTMSAICTVCLEKRKKKRKKDHREVANSKRLLQHLVRVHTLCVDRYRWCRIRLRRLREVEIRDRKPVQGRVVWSSRWSTRRLVSSAQVDTWEDRTGGMSSILHIDKDASICVLVKYRSMMTENW